MKMHEQARNTANSEDQVNPSIENQHLHSAPPEFGGHNAGPGAKIVVITSDKILSKRLKLHQKTGSVEKLEGGRLITGNYKIVNAPDPESLVEVFQTLKHRQATTYGLPVNGIEAGRIASRKAAGRGDLTRTRENFAFPSGPAWLMCDIDLRGLSMDEVRMHFKRAVLGFENAPAVFTHSTSSFIYNGDACLIEEGGKRVYILVQDGRDIPRAAKALAGRLKLAGTLYYDVSKVGSLLERCLIDEMVYQPERLDFSGKCFLIRPLTQKRPDPQIQNNDAAPLDTMTAIPDLTTDEETMLEMMRQAEKEKVKDKAAEIRGKWVEERVKKHEEKSGKKLGPEEKERLRKEYQDSSEKKTLSEDFILYPESGGEVTVRDLLKEPAVWDGERFGDPLEPDYNNDGRIATAHLRGNRPHIWSYAHGGQRFELKEETHTLVFEAGRVPYLVDACTKVLHRDRSVYQRGDELVRVAGEKIYGVEEAWLRNHLEKKVIFKRLREGRKGPETTIVDCPAEVPRRILAGAGEWPFDELKTLADLPILRKDGSILSKPGYDPDTGIILLRKGYDHLSDRVPEKPTETQIQLALERLWYPFHLFPYKSPVDVGVLLAVILTVPTRAILHTAPAFLVRASTYGSGKTYMAEALGAMSGKDPQVVAWPDTQAEQRKSLVSMLTRSPGVLIFDNVLRTWKSPDLAAILTGNTFSDRILGASQMIEVNTSSLFMGTGNNVLLGDDLARRVLVCEIDPRMENPEKRRFSFKPRDHVETNVASLRVDVLTVLRGFMNAGAPSITSDTLGSYEQWDKLVRQAVCWIAKNQFFPVEVGDPVESINQNYALDPNTNKMRALMVNWYNEIGDRPVTVGEVIKLAEIESGLRHEAADQSEFAESIREVAGRGGSIIPNILGSWLGHNKERIVDGYKIVRDTTQNGFQKWRIVKVDQVDQVDLSGPFSDSSGDEKTETYDSSQDAEKVHLVHLGPGSSLPDVSETDDDEDTASNFGFTM